MNIQADNIQVSFGAKKILHDISLDIRDKEFVGIIGPNGSGKSTFLKCFNTAYCNLIMEKFSLMVQK